MDDADIRLEALRLAVAHMSGACGSKGIVAAADDFYKFLSNDRVRKNAEKLDSILDILADDGSH